VKHQGKLKKTNSVDYRPSDRRLLTKLMPTSFADRGCHMVSVMDPYGRILGQGKLNKTESEIHFQEVTN
jgi:hypothetical protein